jgi:hypothetical protein
LVGFLKFKGLIIKDGKDYTMSFLNLFLVHNKRIT